MIQLPTRHISEPNRSAGIGTGYTVLGGSHHAENQITEQNKTEKKTTPQTTNKAQTQNRHCEHGQLSWRNCLMHHRRVISMT